MYSVKGQSWHLAPWHGLMTNSASSWVRSHGGSFLVYEVVRTHMDCQTLAAWIRRTEKQAAVASSSLYGGGGRSISPQQSWDTASDHRRPEGSPSVHHLQIGPPLGALGGCKKNSRRMMQTAESAVPVCFMLNCGDAAASLS